MTINPIETNNKLRKGIKQRLATIQRYQTKNVEVIRETQRLIDKLNNLDLSHYITNDYLISWDKSKIDMPIFDLYNLYNNHNSEFSTLEIFIPSIISTPFH